MANPAEIVPTKSCKGLDTGKRVRIRSRLFAAYDGTNAYPNHTRKPRPSRYFIIKAVISLSIFHSPTTHNHNILISINYSMLKRKMTVSVDYDGTFKLFT